MADTFVKNPKLIVGTKDQVVAEMGANDFGVATDVKFYTAEEIEQAVNTQNLTVGSDEGALYIGVVAGTATIATNNGLDIAAQTKFDTAPTTDDTTAWADVNATALVTKQQVTTALGTAGGGTTITIKRYS